MSYFSKVTNNFLVQMQILQRTFKCCQLASNPGTKWSECEVWWGLWCLLIRRNWWLVIWHTSTTLSQFASSWQISCRRFSWKSQLTWCHLLVTTSPSSLLKFQKKLQSMDRSEKDLPPSAITAPPHNNIIRRAKKIDRKGRRQNYLQWSGIDTLRKNGQNNWQTICVMFT